MSFAGVTIRATALTPDGKVVVAGDDGADAFVARLNPNGVPDITADGPFAAGGQRTFNVNGTDVIRGVAVQPDGKIVLVGSSGFNDFTVVRLNPNGSNDDSFDNNGVQTAHFAGTDEAFAVALQLDGRIVVAGNDGNGDAAIARLDTNGQLDGTFGGGDGKVQFTLGGTDRVRAVAVQINGPIVVVGDDGNDVVVARRLSDGTVDNSFGTIGRRTLSLGSATDQGRGVAIQSDGKILVAADNDADFVVLRLLGGNGDNDPTFRATPGGLTINVTGNDEARAVAVLPNGRIAVVGEDGNDDIVGVLLNQADGSLDTTFGAGGVLRFAVPGNGDGNAVAVTPTGRLVVAGNQGASGFVARAIGTVEKAERLSVGGNLDATALTFVPEADGTYTQVGPGRAFPGLGTNVRTAVADVDGDGFPDTVAGHRPGHPDPGGGASAGGTTRPCWSRRPHPFAGVPSLRRRRVRGRRGLRPRRAGRVRRHPGPQGRPAGQHLLPRPDGTLAAVRANFFGIDDPNFRGGARAAVGDVNADGTPDLAVAAGFAGGPRVALFDGRKILTTTGPTRPTGWSATSSRSRGHGHPQRGRTWRSGTWTGTGSPTWSSAAGGGGPAEVLVAERAAAPGRRGRRRQAGPVASFFVRRRRPTAAGCGWRWPTPTGTTGRTWWSAAGRDRPGRVRVYLGKDFAAAGGEPSRPSRTSTRSAAPSSPTASSSADTGRLVEQLGPAGPAGDHADRAGRDGSGVEATRRPAAGGTRAGGWRSGVLTRCRPGPEAVAPRRQPLSNQAPPRESSATTPGRPPAAPLRPMRFCHALAHPPDQGPDPPAPAIAGVAGGAGRPGPVRRRGRGRR